MNEKLKNSSEEVFKNKNESKESITNKHNKFINKINPSEDSNKFSNRVGNVIAGITGIGGSVGLLSPIFETMSDQAAANNVGLGAASVLLATILLRINNKK